MLKLEDVYKHYEDAGDGDAIRAVDGVSFELARGEVVAVYGPSGSGKTTLLLLMAGLLRPDRGSVSFEGRDLSSMSRREAADHRLRDVGFVFQSFRLMPGMTAVDNAALKVLCDTHPRDARRQVAPLLDKVGLGTRSKQRAARLSMGERQRVAIARALANNPGLVLADEPTGSLDSRRGAEILCLLADLARERGAGVVLATHDPQAADFADRKMMLSDGHLGDASAEWMSGQTTRTP